jgi:hypothetical protein
MSIHAKDQAQIERLHGLAVADIHERLITLQYASYELGYARGLEQGKARRDELLAALRNLEAMAERYRAPGLPVPDAQKTARDAIAKASGVTA